MKSLLIALLRRYRHRERSDRRWGCGEVRRILLSLIGVNRISAATWIHKTDQEGCFNCPQRCGPMHVECMRFLSRAFALVNAERSMHF